MPFYWLVSPTHEMAFSVCAFAVLPSNHAIVGRRLVANELTRSQFGLASCTRRISGKIRSNPRLCIDRDLSGKVQRHETTDDQWDSSVRLRRNANCITTPSQLVPLPLTKSKQYDRVSDTTASATDERRTTFAASLKTWPTAVGHVILLKWT